MSGKRYHTIVIISSVPGRRTLRLTLPVRAWGLMAILISMLSLLSAAGIWGLNHRVETKERCLWLVKQNRAAFGLLEAHVNRERSLALELKQIRKQAAFIQGFLGLQSGGAGGNLGQGGTEIGPDRPSADAGRAPAAVSRSLAPSDALFPLSEMPKEITTLRQDLDHLIQELETRQAELEHTPSISPVDPRHAWISSPFGMRISPFTGKEQFHLGLDIAAWKGTPIMAAAKGKVIYVGNMGPLGLMVKIQHGRGLVTEYGHLLKARVKQGQTVSRGEVIAYMGDSGRSTGYHLHYGIKRDGRHLDPRVYMVDWEKNAWLSAEAEPDKNLRK